LRLPSEVREYRERRRVERAHRLLADALRAFFEGRYAKAEKAAAELLEAREFAGFAGVMAARAAHELRAYDRRDRFLARAYYYADADQTMRAITQADLALQERDYQRALTALEPLAQKHTAALRLELKAVQQTRNWDRYLELLNQLARAHGLEASQIDELRRFAITQNFARKSRDASELANYWRRLDASDRRDPVIALGAARAFMQVGNCEEVSAVIEAGLDAGWDSDLVALYGECPAQNPLRQIERAEKWLASHASDAALLLTLGQLCMRQQLWGKARSYFEASLSVEQSYAGHMRLAQLLEKLGEMDAARDHYRKSLELATSALSAASSERATLVAQVPR
jgi:HemY protein